jgi:uncharacterized protein YerC
MEKEEQIIDCSLQNGYRRLQFTIKGVSHGPLVHRLVATLFIDNPDQKPFVNHKDLDKLNNRVDNLEWVTPSENIQHWVDNRKNYKRSKEIPACGMTAMDGEEFRELKPGLFVSSFGRVYGRYRSYSTFLKPSLGGPGYLRIMATVDGIKYNLSIHRIVAELFCENPNGYGLVNHKDADRLNNRADNLEWCSAKMNVKHGFDRGLNKNVGENHRSSTHSDEKIAEVISLLNSGLSYAKVSKQTGVSEAHIYRLKHGHARSNSTLIPPSEKGPMTKLSEVDVLEIKKMIFNGAKRKDVAGLFNVSVANVSNIAKGLSWANVGSEYTVRNPKKQNKLTEQQLLYLIEMIKNNVSPTVISREIGCSKSYIYIVKEKYLCSN